MPEPEEVAHYDDAFIGRAFRWSVAAFAFLALAAGVVVYAVNRRPAAAPVKLTVLEAPEVPPALAELPLVRFTDVTLEAGIQFVHETGATGEKLLPETMGGGVAFFDFDNDGDADLFFVNSGRWPWSERLAAAPATSRLYRNDGQGRFEDVTAGSGLDVDWYGMGVAAGDYDNDGRADLLVTGVGGTRLFRNEGNGRFRDVTVEAGVGGTPNDWSTGAAWMDFDNDGDLDLFVGNYIRWSREIDFEVAYTLVGIGRAYGPPTNFEGAFSRLFRNDGVAGFVDVSASSGIQVRNPATGVPVGKPLGVAPVDVDGDGWIDLVVANDTVQNFLFLNRRDGTFAEVGASTGVAFDTYGNTRGAMGIDAARFQNNDRLGVAIGNFANEMTALYVAQQAATQFADEAIAQGIGPASRLPLKFGIFFFDYDLDGWLDLLTANGHLEQEIHQVQQSQTYPQPAQLFWNAGGAGVGGFVVASPGQAGPDLFRPIVGRGSAFADLDGDGDLDVVLTQAGGRPLLLRNDQQLGHHWLRVRLVGRRANRDAIGAWVILRSNGLTQARQVMPTRSYLSQSELPVTFGLGRDSVIDALEVIWPGGETERFAGVQPDQAITIEQAR